MKRRDALKLIAGAATLPALYCHDVFALGREIHQQLGASAALRTFNSHQNATVTAIAEMIIPATETPGAKGARVNEFIDLILSEWCTGLDCRRFVAGLADVDTRSRKLFGNDFVRCSIQQQTELLTAMDEGLTELREATERGRRHESAAVEEVETPVEKSFFYMMKRLTLVGYYTSEVGWTRELARPPVHFGAYKGCVPLATTPEKANAG